jgi:hypothetical protein
LYDKTTANAFRRGEVLLGKGLEIFDMIRNEGLGGLWDHIKESLGTILADTLDMIKETVLYAAIKKVIIEIGKMLVPGGGFIAIAEKIIRLLQFIVEARNKILDLIESFVDSMENAVKGDIPGIVKRITGALTKFITIALDFLITFFGLGGLKEKVERFIDRMRKPIIRGIDWILGKIKPFVMRAMTKGKELIVKGKELVAKGKAALGLDIDKQVTLGQEKHTLRGHIEDDRVTILMSSNNLVDIQRQVDVIKTEWVQRLGDPERAKQLAERFEGVKTMARNFQKELVQISRQNKEKAQGVLDDNLSTLDNALEQIADDFGFAELMQVEVKKDDLIVDMNEGSWWVVKLINVKVVNERKKPSFGIQAVKYTDPDQEKLFRYDEYTKTWGSAGSSQEPGSFHNPFEFNEAWPKPVSDKYPTLYFGGETTETISQKDLEKLQGQEYPPGSNIKVKPYTPHGGGRLPGGPVIGLKQVHHGWHLKVGTKVGPLQPEGVTTPGGGKLIDILKRYGFDSTNDKLQGDHVHEIQVGGDDDLKNLWPLDTDINQTSGSKIRLASVHYPNGRGAEKISDLKKTTDPPNKYWFIIKKVLT